MPRHNQELRPSQFITTYGPGSIVETRSGPVVPKSLYEVFSRLVLGPSQFEIGDERLRHAALGGGRITSIPTNAELSMPGADVIYPTTPFPAWSLCTGHGIDQILHPSSRPCPVCAANGVPRDSLKTAREAIRFVMACPAGHMDDVPWQRLVHGANSSCQPNHFIWRGGGRALRHVTLECPTCHAPQNFGQAYARPWLCSGRVVETGPRPQQSTCPHEARIHQRGAANLHMAELVSALTIVDMPARLHKVLNDGRILGTAATLKQLNLLDRSTFLKGLMNQAIPAGAVALIEEADWDQVLDALDHFIGLQPDRPLKAEEFERLRNAATNGAPAVPGTHPGSPPLFEVRKAAVRTVRRTGGSVDFRITPITRLRMVMVQTGYRRVDPLAHDVMPTSFDWQGSTWFPGVELFGEGIFIDAPSGLTIHGDRAQVWSRRSSSADVVTDAERDSPVHVWWHTFSHRLLRTMSIDSGYSSAAIRERVYLDNTGQSERGGLLLFTVQPGGDGTLGGLIALAEQFGDVIDSALRDLADCSNDPLCLEAPASGAPGAACYSCLLASETSCEQRNLALDRGILLENLP